MKAICNVLLITLIAAVTSLADDRDAARKDLASLQGEWTMVSGSADGQPMSAEMLKQMKRTCKGNEVTVMMGDMVFLKAKFKVDASKKPKTIDYSMTEGFTKGKQQLGIYELNGDVFRACFGKPGAERPADFTSEAGDGRTLSVWKRAKTTADQK